MKKRSKKTYKIILLSFGIAVFVIGAAAGLFIYSELSKIGGPQKLEEIAPENEIFDTENNIDLGTNIPQYQPEEIVWPSDGGPDAEAPAAGSAAPVKPADEKKRINILLIGQDKRPGEKRARSDSMILASYSKNDRTLKLISLMRDMYVQIPGYSDNRINAAYSFGGMALLDKTIKKDFGVEIDGNIEVNFEGFTQLVDILGGIDIELQKAEAAHLNKENGWKLKEGKNHLNGQQTLEYARIRHVGNGDYERTERQRNVLLQIFDKAVQLNLTAKYQMLDKMLPFLSTDMTKNEILGYAYTVVTGGVKSTKSYRLPADGTYKTAKIRKMAVLVPNLTKNRALLNSYMKADPGG